jgi:hypothetical protein
MILNVEKIHAIKFQQLVMVPLDNTKSTMWDHEKNLVKLFILFKH